jgi:hypothetical protein
MLVAPLYDIPYAGTSDLSGSLIRVKGVHPDEDVPTGIFDSCVNVRCSFPALGQCPVERFRHAESESNAIAHAIAIANINAAATRYAVFF